MPRFTSRLAKKKAKDEAYQRFYDVVADMRAADESTRRQRQEYEMGKTSFEKEADYGKSLMEQLIQERAGREQQQIAGEYDVRRAETTGRYGVQQQQVAGEYGLQDRGLAESGSTRRKAMEIAAQGPYQGALTRFTGEQADELSIENALSRRILGPMGEAEAAQYGVTREELAQELTSLIEGREKKERMKKSRESYVAIPSPNMPTTGGFEPMKPTRGRRIAEVPERLALAPYRAMKEGKRYAGDLLDIILGVK